MSHSTDEKPWHTPPQPQSSGVTHSPGHTIGLTHADADRLIEALRLCTAMREIAQRTLVLDRLDPEIFSRIEHSNTLLVHVTNIVKTCAAYPGGLVQLSDALSYVEGQSRAAQRVIELVESIVSDSSHHASSEKPGAATESEGEGEEILQVEPDLQSGRKAPANKLAPPTCPECGKSTEEIAKLLIRKRRYQCQTEDCPVSAAACFYLVRRSGKTVARCSWWPGERMALWLVFLGFVPMLVDWEGVLSLIVQWFTLDADLTLSNSSTHPSSYSDDDSGGLTSLCLGISMAVLGQTIEKPLEKRLAIFFVSLIAIVSAFGIAAALGFMDFKRFVIAAPLSAFGLGALIHMFLYQRARDNGLLPYEIWRAIAKYKPSLVWTWDVLIVGAFGLIGLSALLDGGSTEQEWLEKAVGASFLLTYSATRVAFAYFHGGRGWMAAGVVGLCGGLSTSLAGLEPGPSFALAIVVLIGAFGITSTLDQQQR